MQLDFVPGVLQDLRSTRSILKRVNHVFLSNNEIGRPLAATVVSLYILLTLSLVQVLGVTYILLSGVSDPLLLAGEFLIIAGVSIEKHSLVPP